MATVRFALACVIAVASCIALDSGVFARNVLEEVVDTLPRESQILLVSQGLFYEHPECHDPIEDDSESLVHLVIEKLRNQLTDRQNRGKTISFDSWGTAEKNYTREEREEIADYGRETGATHVLYYRATRQYVANPGARGYTPFGVEWEFRLVDLKSNRSQFFRGTTEKHRWLWDTSLVPVSCP